MKNLVPYDGFIPQHHSSTTPNQEEQISLELLSTSFKVDLQTGIARCFQTLPAAFKEFKKFNVNCLLFQDIFL